MTKQYIWLGACSILVSLALLAGCSGRSGNQDSESQAAAGQTAEQTETGTEQSGGSDSLSREIVYEVEPETFTLNVLADEEWICVSPAMPVRPVADFTQEDGITAWSYPDEKVSIMIKPVQDYLEVTITSETEEDNEFCWPDIAGDTYYLPLGEGKRIPATDPVWADYLSGQEFEVLEQLSMPFWTSIQGEHGIMFLLANSYRSTLEFGESERISFALNHRYPAIDDQKDHVFRIYVTDNSPVTAAKIYRNYVIEKGDFVTLAEKAEDNPDIRKLYGAPHIYLAGDFVLSPDDINWPAFRQALSSDEMQYILAYGEDLESGTEMKQAAVEIAAQDYVSQYQKQIVCRYLSEALKQEDFIDEEILTQSDDYMAAAAEGSKMDPVTMIQWNKHALAANFPAVFQPAGSWMEQETTELIKDLKESGISQAWIGLHSWEQAFARPELTDTAVDQGYLIGPYDSYHSIHQPGAEQWITAAFPDASLYDQAAVRDRSGQPYAGFQNVGRKLNPVLAMPAVRERVTMITDTPVQFNSWFIDCDATGEIYDDYSPEHPATRQQDLQARLERMAYIRDGHGMVIGSEGGHDFAASTIAFAHGIELKSFAWMDEDMKTNTQSEYYLGKYYNPGGGVPEHFARRVPVKENLYTIFVAPEYDIPLYKLVYNDSVITTYHWDWSTFKIAGATNDRMLREVLYNVPPLYHLDRTEWEEYKTDIVTHTVIWSDLSKAAVNQEMTDFQDLAGDGSIQLCRYGDDISVIANFGDGAVMYEGRSIEGHSLLIINGNETIFYSPQIAESHR